MRKNLLKLSMLSFSTLIVLFFISSCNDSLLRLCAILLYDFISSKNVLTRKRDQFWHYKSHPSQSTSRKRTEVQRHHHHHHGPVGGMEKEFERERGRSGVASEQRDERVFASDERDK